MEGTSAALLGGCWRAAHGWVGGMAKWSKWREKRGREKEPQERLRAQRGAKGRRQPWTLVKRELGRPGNDAAREKGRAGVAEDRAAWGPFRLLAANKPGLSVCLVTPSLDHYSLFGGWELLGRQRWKKIE